MTARPQVRLDEDVAKAIEERRGDRSLSQATNAHLRTALGLGTKGRPHGGTASVSAASGGVGRRSAYSSPGACKHPLGRRIGTTCSQCGATVTGRR